MKTVDPVGPLIACPIVETVNEVVGNVASTQDPSLATVWLSASRCVKFPLQFQKASLFYNWKQVFTLVKRSSFFWIICHCKLFSQEHKFCKNFVRVFESTDSRQSWPGFKSCHLYFPGKLDCFTYENIIRKFRKWFSFSLKLGQHENCLMKLTTNSIERKRLWTKRKQVRDHVISSEESTIVQKMKKRDSYITFMLKAFNFFKSTVSKPVNVNKSKLRDMSISMSNIHIPKWDVTMNC